MEYCTESPIPLASSHPLFPVRLTAGTDRALLESNPSSPDGAIGSLEGNRAQGKGRFPRSHSPRFDKLRGLGQSPISAGRRVLPCLQCPDENKQLFHRLPLEIVEVTLAAFNDRHLSPDDACARLRVGQSRLYTLRGPLAGRRPPSSARQLWRRPHHRLAG